MDGPDVFPIQSRRAMAGPSSPNAWDCDGRSILVGTPRFFCKPHSGDSDYAVGAGLSEPRTVLSQTKPSLIKRILLLIFMGWPHSKLSSTMHMGNEPFAQR